MGVSGEPRHADGGYACAEVTKKAGSCGEFGGDGVGERIPVDHIIPLSVCPELDNQVLNLELLPASLNSSKRDKVGQRQVTFANELREAGLISQESLSNVEASSR